MKKFVFGFLLIFLNFNLNFNQFSLNVLPDFVGYYLLMKGMEEMKRESPRFENASPFAIGMIIYTAVLWLGALLNVGGGVLGMVLSVIAQVVHFYIAWVLVQALREMEQNHGADLYGSVLLSRWKILLGLNVAIQLLRVLASVGTIRIVMTIATVLVLAALMVFTDNGVIPAWANMIILSREFVISSLRMVAAAQGIVIAAAMWGKVKTFSQMVCLCILLLRQNFVIIPGVMTLQDLCVWVMVAVALISGVVYLKDNFHVIREGADGRKDQK